MLKPDLNLQHSEAFNLSMMSCSVNTDFVSSVKDLVTAFGSSETDERSMKIMLKTLVRSLVI